VNSWLDHLRTWIRWRLASRHAASFPRPRHIGRGVRINGNVKFGRDVELGDAVTIEGDVVVGDGAAIEPGVLIRGSVVLGEGAQIGRHTYIGTGPSGHLSIGTHVHIGWFGMLGAMQRLTIGDHCIFAPYVQITDAEHGLDHPDHVKYAPIDSAPVSIGEGVWLGSHTVVLKGARIGARGAIGAHSLVRGEIPDNAVAFGIPAKVHRMRSDRAVS